jgi:hypothetical protein
MTLQLTKNQEALGSVRPDGLNAFIERAFLAKMPSLLPFVRGNKSLVALARRLKREERSPATLYQYAFGAHRYSDWTGRGPDQIIEECIDADRGIDNKVVSRHVEELARFVDILQDEGLCHGTINNHVKGVKALYRASGIRVDLPFRLSKRVRYKDRAPTADELQRLLDVADLRGKVIISFLALGGFREGTLCQLRYRHVKRDLEADRVPLHVHVESDIVKGHYGDYDTFLGREPADYARLYFDDRRAGSVYRTSKKNAGLRRGPETITDDSPLIISSHSSAVKALSPGRVHDYVHDLYLKAGLIGTTKAVRYELRAHSIRKFFKTQLLSLNVQESYVDFMMGHKVDTYHDIESKGTEFLRGIYAAANLSIRPRTQLSQREMAMKMLEAMGVKPEELLTKEAQSYPRRAYSSTLNGDRKELEILTMALRDAITARVVEKKQNVIC